MSSVNSDAIVGMKEFGNYVFAKHVPRTPLRKAETLHVWLGIRPHKISEWPLVWNLLYSGDLGVYVLDVLQGRG